MTVVIAIVIAVAFLAVILLAAAIRILREYERAVVFRLGRLIGAKGPGLILLIAVVDRMVRVDLRTVTLNIPPQEVITRDNVPARVNAVAYFHVVDATKAIVDVEDFLARGPVGREMARRRACPARSSSPFPPGAPRRYPTRRRAHRGLIPAREPRRDTRSPERRVVRERAMLVGAAVAAAAALATTAAVYSGPVDTVADVVLVVALLALAHATFRLID